MAKTPGTSLHRFLAASLARLLVLSAALAMVYRAGERVVFHLGRIIVLLTVKALTPPRIATRIKRTLALVQEKVIGAVRAYNEVLGAIVWPNAVDVVHLFGARQIATHGAFGHQNMLEYIPPPRMSWATLQDVAMGLRYPTAPVRILLGGASRAMVGSKADRFALDPPTPRHGAFRDWRGQTAAALAEP